MTHYTINYTSLEENIKVRQACYDTLDYVGADKFRKLVKLIKVSNKFPLICLGFSFVGVNGYPVEAMITKYSPEKLQAFKDWSEKGPTIVWKDK